MPEMAEEGVLNGGRLAGKDPSSLKGPSSQCLKSDASFHYQLTCLLWDFLNHFSLSGT